MNQLTMESTAKVALTIAASDSSSGAGVQVDLAVFRDAGVYGVCAITNVTAQNSRGVHKVSKVAPNIIAAQIDAATKDLEIDACKIGMLYSPQAVGIASERIARRNIDNVVLDPVMQAKNGETLLTEPAIKRLKRWLIPKVRLVTPNADEASKLTGIDVNSLSDARDAARALVDMGAKNALVKGGHISGEPIDVLYDGQLFLEYRSERIAKSMHGTGCVLSAAITARLALGDDLVAAVDYAKKYVFRAIKQAQRFGKGDMQYYTGTGREASDWND